jgi:hypothetical protein
MRREPVLGPNARWQPWRWTLDAVVPQVLHAHSGDSPQCVHDQAGVQRWFFPGFEVVLHREDAEGYYLNLTTPAPCWFVLWRMDVLADLPGASGEPVGVPQLVSLSYHDAGRFLDAQEQVDQVPADDQVLAWLSVFTQAHYVPEPKRRQRPQSFQPLKDRFGLPASISTGDSRRKGGADHGR